MSAILKTLNFVERAVESPRENEYAIAISNVYQTDIDDLWDACTNQERIPRWFAPVTGDLKLGGTYQIEGNASGTIETCDPPHSFTATWEFGEGFSRIDVRLTAEEGGTRLTLRHIAAYDEHWDKYGPASGGVGWDLAILGLNLYFEESLQEGLPTDNVEEWFATDDAKAFMAQSAELWKLAHVESGADEATATAMADRTLAFYTGAETE